MYKKDVNEELFDRVYQNEASEEELAQFKLRLKDDEAYRKAFQQYLQINEAVLKDARERFREKFKGKAAAAVSHQDSTPEPRATRLRLWSPLRIAASFLVLVTLSFLTYNQFNYWENLSQKYALIIDEAHLLGPEENETLQANQVQKNEAQMEKGFQYLKEENFPLAIAAFETVQPISTQEYDDYFTAQYNVALAQLKLQKVEQAQLVLTQLSQRSEKHYLKAKAKQLLKDLAKPKFLFF